MLAGWKTLDTQNNSYDYRLIGRRPERPLKRLLDGENREVETNHLLA